MQNDHVSNMEEEKGTIFTSMVYMVYEANKSRSGLEFRGHGAKTTRDREGAGKFFFLRAHYMM